MNMTINVGEFASIVAGLMLVGAILKNAIPQLPNRWIPLITWILGVIAYLSLTNGWKDANQWIAAIVTAATATGAHSGIKNTLAGNSVDPKIGLLVVMIFMIGCARFTTTQTDLSYEQGQITRQVTTRASALTFIESKSALANFKATQTDKTQSASVGQLSQESNSTNAISDAAMFLGTLIKAAK